MIIPIRSFGFGSAGYDIHIDCGLLHNVSAYIDGTCRVLIVTDTGVPAQYVNILRSQLSSAEIVTLPQGEKSKNPDHYLHLLRTLAQKEFSRNDCIVALGGGVVGDISGFAAATYMRGIRFINIPTTLLSMVDSSIGGKVAIDIDGVKNIAGAFYPPSAVLIDPCTLDTLDDRQLKAGYAETVKMAACCDADLFHILEPLSLEDVREKSRLIIERSLRIKGNVVEQDPTEKGLRRVLNFGHTIGHAIESCQHGAMLHGECVALGMLPMCSTAAGARIERILDKVGLPTRISVTAEELIPYLKLDKKKTNHEINTVWVESIGSFAFRTESPETICSRLDSIMQERKG